MNMKDKATVKAVLGGLRAAHASITPLMQDSVNREQNNVRPPREAPLLQDAWTHLSEAIEELEKAAAL